MTKGRKVNRDRKVQRVIQVLRENRGCQESRVPKGSKESREKLVRRVIQEM